MGLSWHCPKPRSSLLARRWGAGASLCQAARCPSRAGSQACAPCEPRGSVTPVLALECQSFGWGPTPSERTPCCPCQIPTGKATLLVRAAAARLGRAGCLIWQQIIHPSASIPKQVCALHLAAACKYFPLRCGMLLPGKARLPARSPRGLAAVSHLPLLKAFPWCFHTELPAGCVPPGPGRQ